MPPGLASMCVERDFEQVAITFDHAEMAAALPRHHDDPFDRMLIAQALHEGWQLVSADLRFADYGVSIIDASR